MSAIEHQAVNGSARREFQRGWAVLLACFIGVAVSAPSVGGYTGGVFVGPLEEEFGWSRAAISLHTLLSVGVVAFAVPVVGILIDRMGVRPVVLASMALYALSMVAMSFLFNSLLFYYALGVLITIVAAGTTPVVYTKVVNSWFNKARGLALGLALLGSGLTAALAPVLLTAFVDTNGWRFGYLALAGVIVLGLLIVAPLIREHPLEVDDPDTGVGSARGLPAEIGVRRSDALRSRTFILLAIPFSLAALAVGGLTLHFIPMLTDQGMSRSAAAQHASLIGISVLVGRIGTGILIDRYFAPRVTMIMFLTASLGFLALLIGGTELAFLTAIAVGFTVGAEIDLIGYLTSRYFGLRDYGAIYGILYSIFIVGIGVAPVVTGLIFDLAGSYDYSLLLSGAALAAAGLFCLALKPFPDFSSQDIDV